MHGSLLGLALAGGDLALDASRIRPERERSSAWDRVYQSANLSPSHPNLATTKYLPREIGFRGLVGTTEPDGTPVLIASGVGAKALLGSQVAGTSLQPDLLYTTNGTTWTKIPDDPGTTLGDVSQTSYRGLVQIGSRIFTVNGNLDGAGSIYAADWANTSCSPLQGDNCWYQITNPSIVYSEIASYNGFLYLGTYNTAVGQSVLKADPTQPLTATWALSTVVPPGAGLSILTQYRRLEHERLYADDPTGHSNARMALRRRQRIGQQRLEPSCCVSIPMTIGMS